MDRIKGLEKSGCMRTAQFRSFSFWLRKAESQSAVQSVGLSFLKTPGFCFSFPTFLLCFWPAVRAKRGLAIEEQLGMKCW